MLAMESYPALVLNADYRPVRTYPLKRYSWRKSIEQFLAGRVTVVAEYDRVVRSERMEIRIPSVVALNRYENLDRPAPLTRLGVFTRDRFRCAICGESFPGEQLTFDHVVPQSRGGRSTWTNLVAACLPCNQRKGDRSLAQLGMKLVHEPYHPTLAQLNAIGATMPVADDIDRSWRDWLYWTVTLDP
jgi:Restriction endonuclease